MNYKLTLAFCGTRYHGWQVQSNAVSVCTVVQDAVEAVFGRRYSVTGCSRTDSGVHATGFVALLQTEAAIPPASLLKALNTSLPYDVAVMDCVEVPTNFHPRYDASAKRYLYRMYDAPVRDPFRNERMWHIPRPLHEDRMNMAAQALLGRHNFSSFCASGGKIPEEQRVRTILACGVARAGDTVTLSITGDGFLYNMVRIIAGTLCEVSSGKLEPQAMAEIIASQDRSRAGLTAPACGLYLDRVYYDKEEDAAL